MFYQIHGVSSVQIVFFGVLQFSYLTESTYAVVSTLGIKNIGKKGGENSTTDLGDILGGARKPTQGQITTGGHGVIVIVPHRLGSYPTGRGSSAVQH